jgi:hypothetical protein
MFRRAALTACVRPAQTRTISGGAKAMFARSLRANKVLKHAGGQKGYYQALAAKFDALPAAKKAEFKAASKASPQKSAYTTFIKKQIKTNPAMKKCRGEGSVIKAIAKLWKASKKGAAKKK